MSVLYKKENGCVCNLSIYTKEFEDKREEFKGFKSFFVDGNGTIVGECEHNHIHDRAIWAKGYFAAIKEFQRNEKLFCETNRKITNKKESVLDFTKPTWKGMNIELIETAYAKVSKLVNEEPLDKSTRNLIKTEMEKLLPNCRIKCDEENNPPDRLNCGHIFVKVIDDKINGYVDVIF